MVKISKMSKILQDISESGGTIRTRELSVPRGYYGINKELNSGSIIRIKNGVYILPEEQTTMMMDIERIVPGGVICLYSAQEGRSTKMTDIILCYWEEKYCSLGVEEVVIANHRVKIFCIEKCVCDAIKFRNKIGTDVAVEILSNYLHRKDRNISLLMDFAKQMRVISTIQPYLEMGLYRL